MLLLEEFCIELCVTALDPLLNEPMAQELRDSPFNI